MSVVTNLILTLGIADEYDQFISSFDLSFGLERAYFARVDQHVKGSKAMEANVYIAAVNYIDEEKLLHFLKVTLKEKLERYDYDELRLFINRQEEEGFHLAFSGDKPDVTELP